jgi:hypothetical protein
MMMFTGRQTGDCVEIVKRWLLNVAESIRFASEFDVTQGKDGPNWYAYSYTSNEQKAGRYILSNCFKDKRPWV